MSSSGARTSGHRGRANQHPGPCFAQDLKLDSGARPLQAHAEVAPRQALANAVPIDAGGDVTQGCIGNQIVDTGPPGPQAGSGALGAFEHANTTEEIIRIYVTPLEALSE